MRLALVGDVHLYSLNVRPRQLLSKRLLGHANLWLNRRRRFNHHMFGHVIARVSDLKPDLALFSGDVTTTSLEDEFRDIRDYLKPLATQTNVVVVPGNHDRYTFRSARRKRMERILANLIPREFPHIQPLTDRWHLVALDSAQPQVMLSRGALGPRQFDAVQQYVNTLSEDDGLVVLCHYPVALPGRMPRSWAHDLAEARGLKQLLTEAKPRVVFMHGHIHRPWFATPNGNQRPPFTCINAGSPCLTSEEYPLGQGFWQITLPDKPADALTAVHHVLRPQASFGYRRQIEPRHLNPTWEERIHPNHSR